MAIEIVYIEEPNPPEPTWKDQEGKLYTPVPRDAKEAGEVVEKLLAKGGVKKITIDIT
jgi:hypothetical protein